MLHLDAAWVAAVTEDKHSIDKEGPTVPLIRIDHSLARYRTFCDMNALLFSSADPGEKKQLSSLSSPISTSLPGRRFPPHTQAQRNTGDCSQHSPCWTPRRCRACRWPIWPHARGWTATR